VAYPASFSLKDCTGVKDLIRRIKERVDSCPGIKIALGGHSQGGAVVAVAVPQIPQKYISSIVAVTLFGSPPCSDIANSKVAGMAEVASRCRSFCNYKDTVRLVSAYLAHLS
jgi:alpha-beta hydrolase superfamily lysophospholipase